MRVHDALDLEGRADEEALTAEELALLGKVASAMGEMGRLAGEAKTCGDLRKAETRLEELDAELDAL